MNRRDQILETAADLFASKGFHGVSVSEIGRACGISGPALYKHFDSKDAVLAAMLIGISEQLLEEGGARVAKARTPREAIESLVAWHTDFALRHRSLIVVQERDWPSLPPAARERVRHLQREYVDIWAGQLRRHHRGLHTDRARAMAHAAFGLINSTPHTRLIPDESMRGVLHRMAMGALVGGGP